MRIVTRRTKVTLPRVTLPQRMRLMPKLDKEREDEGRWIDEPRGGSPFVFGSYPRGVNGLKAAPVVR